MSNFNFAVICNHSIKDIFLQPALDIVSYLEKCGEKVLLSDNFKLSLLKDSEIKLYCFYKGGAALGKALQLSVSKQFE